MVNKDLNIPIIITQIDEAEILGKFPLRHLRCMSQHYRHCRPFFQKDDMLPLYITVRIQVFVLLVQIQQCEVTLFFSTR